MKVIQGEAILGELFSKFIESYAEPLIIFNAETQDILYLNEKARKFWGESNEISSFLQEDEYLNFIKLIRDCHREEENRVISYKRENGSNGVLIFNLYPLAIGELRYVILTFRDITEKVRQKEERRRKNAQLILQDKLKSIDLITSGISHEINNICNFMVNNLKITFQAWNDVMNIIKEYGHENGEFLIGGIPSTEIDSVIPKLMMSLIEGINRVTDTIDDFKKYVREGLNSESHFVDINEVIKRVVTILNYHIFIHTENFTLNLADSLPEIKGNRQKLEQVIINLLTNALQALTSREKRVVVSTGVERERVYIEIKDEGIGIPKYALNQIFEPFFSTKLSMGGSGLGLYLSKSIIEEFNGEITINSEENKGTIVKVYLPYHSDGKI